MQAKYLPASRQYIGERTIYRGEMDGWTKSAKELAGLQLGWSEFRVDFIASNIQNSPREGLLENRLRHGKAHFETAGAIPLASTNSGMRFETAVLDPETGPETILILTDTTPFVCELKRKQPFELRLTSGAVRTTLGPVLFLFWYVPPVTHGKPFALYEHILNPANLGTLAGLRQTSEQTHLHLILVGPGGAVLDVYEFENVFDIGSLVPTCEWACKEYPGMDFAAAKEEYDDTYDMMELFHEGLSRA